MTFEATVFWIILIAAVLWLHNRFFGLGERKSSSYGKSQDVSANKKMIEIPQDANLAVSRFAWLCNLTRRQIKTMGGIRDDNFSSASIHLSFGKTDSDNQASFRFSFDYSLYGLYKMLGYELGSGLSIVDGDRVEYSSNSISELKSWGGMSAGYNEVAAQSLLELVAITFTNECPDAYVHSRFVGSDGLLIMFKFR